MRLPLLACVMFAAFAGLISTVAAQDVTAPDVSAPQRRIREKLAASRPTHAETQRELVGAYVAMPEVTQEREWWQRTLATAERLRQSGILDSPEYDRSIESIRKSLEAVK
jgi:hypothetical protein